MNKTIRACIQFEKEILRSVAKVEERLRRQGFHVGEIAHHQWRGVFKITRIESTYHANYRKANVTLYGNKKLKNTTFGQAEHYIGRVYEVELL